MSTAQQHVLATVIISGNEKVSFRTHYGWAEEMSIKIDAVDFADAKSLVHSYLKDLSMVPFQNDADCERYVEESVKYRQELIESISELEMKNGKVKVLAVYPFNIEIIFEESYVVNFG